MLLSSGVRGEGAGRSQCVLPSVLRGHAPGLLSGPGTSGWAVLGGPAPRAVMEAWSVWEQGEVVLMASRLRVGWGRS